MSRRRRIIFYSFLFLLAGGLLFWQWKTEPVHQGERLGTWLNRTNDTNAEVRAEAATALGQLCDRSTDSWLNHDGEKAWKELVTMSLYDADDHVRENAVKALTSLCQTPSQKDEAKRIERGSERVSSRCSMASRSAMSKSAGAFRRSCIKSQGWSTTNTAFVGWPTTPSIRRCGPAAVMALVGRAKDADDDVRDEAVKYLGKLAKVPVEAEPALLKQLQAKDAVTRCGAALALKNLQRISDAAIPGLVVAVQDDIPDVRRPAFFCLVRIGPKAAPALKEALAKTTDAARRGYLELCLKAFDVKKAG